MSTHYGYATFLSDSLNFEKFYRLPKNTISSEAFLRHPQTVQFGWRVFILMFIVHDSAIMHFVIRCHVYFSYDGCCSVRYRCRSWWRSNSDACRAKRLERVTCPEMARGEQSTTIQTLVRLKQRLLKLSSLSCSLPNRANGRTCIGLYSY